MTRAGKSGAKRRPGRPPKASIEQENSNDDTTSIQHETRSSKKQKTIQHESSISDMDTSDEHDTYTGTDEQQQPHNTPKFKKQQAQKPKARKIATRSKNKLSEVPQDSTPVELDKDTEERQTQESQTPPTRQNLKPTDTVSELPPKSTTPPTRQNLKPTDTVSEQPPNSKTPPTSPAQINAPKPTTSVTQQPTETQNPQTSHKPQGAPKSTAAVAEKPPKSKTPPTSPTQINAPKPTTTVTQHPTGSQNQPTSHKPQEAPKPTTTVTEQPPETQNTPTSHTPHKAHKPTTTVIVQPPVSQNPPTSLHKPPKAPKPTTTNKEGKVTLSAANKKPYMVSKSRLGKNSIHLGTDVLSHLVPSSTEDEMMLKTRFLGPRTLHWDTLADLDVNTQFSEWITPLWRRFFDLKRPVYKRLIFEFFSTYKFNKHVTSMNTTAMSFTLCGKDFKISVEKFGVAMNLYTEEELEANPKIGMGFCNLPYGANLADFWSTFGDGKYDINTSCKSINKPAYRILHRLISESINQRGSCTQLVTQTDLFYMFCIVNNQPCNIAKCLARYLYTSVGKSDKSAVCGGAFVTQLAVGLGAITEEELDKMEVLAVTSFFDLLQLKKLEIIEKEPPWRFVDPSRDAAEDAKEKNTTDDASRLNAVEREVHDIKGEVRDIKGQLHWLSEGLHFLIDKLGHSFEPPPHVKDTFQATVQNTSASPHTSNEAGSSPSPSSS